MKEVIELIDKKYKLTTLGSKGFDGMKVKGMTFSINSYNAEGLGHVSTMCAKGFFGLMKMDTLIINPSEIDLPLLSYDRIHVMGKDKRQEIIIGDLSNEYLYFIFLSNKIFSTKLNPIKYSYRRSNMVS